jgi:uncharacterized repeat protein (TIGR01451 family)/fimbrial isopeptide formation D2 family protein
MNSGITFLSRAARVLVALLGSAGVAVAQTCAVPGNDGPVTVTGVPNTYYSAPAGNTASGSTITLGAIRGAPGSTTPIAAGDLILIMQMQDGSATDFSAAAATYGTNTGTAGLYEYARVTNVAGVTVTLSAPLTNTYVQNYGNRQTYQVIRVPQYSSAIISGVVSAAPWDVNIATGAASGGVFAIDVAGSLTMNAGANINVTGQGFRGGAGRNGTSNRIGGLFGDMRYPSGATAATIDGASKGEGTAGTPRYVFNGTATPLDYGVEGYTNGSHGRGSPGNAGGGGNDGTPPTGTNQFNSGGGGGGNAGAGGIGGNSWSNNNAAGGAGGKAATNSQTRLVMGGGGGAGSANNNLSANAISIYPPTTITPTPRSNVTNPVANGAQGPISLSGAAGGGIVLVRTGSIAATAGAQINADGYRAYNTNGNAANGASTSGTGSSEGAGAGGAGGSVFITSVSSTGANLTINARGGVGGDPDFHDHGPGGGGGGGFVLRSTGLTGLATVVTGGVNGLEGIQGPDPTPPANAYGSTAGTAGSGATTTASSSTGVGEGAVCRPTLTVAKTTSTPTRTSETTGTYTITVSNAANLGPASGVNVVDVLPTPFTYTPASVTPVYTGGASGPATITPTSSVSLGVTTVTIGTAAGTAANSFTIPAGGQVSLTIIVNLNSATPGTYQNPADTNYLDPTRNVAGTTIQPGGTYQTGGGTSGGSNYASASTTLEDIVILAPPTVLKAFNPSYVGLGQISTLTITLGNTNAGVATLTTAFTDIMPGSVVIAGTPNANTTCTGVGAVTTTANSVTLPATRTIPASGTCTITVDVISNSAGVFNNVIPVNTLQTNFGNALAASATLTVFEPIKRVKLLTDADSSGAPSIGDTIQYQITYALPVGATNITNFQIFDILPSQVNPVPPTGANVTVTVGVGSTATENTLYTGVAGATTSSLLLGGAILGANSSIIITIDAVINNTITPNTPFNNNARGGGTGLAAVSGNGSGGGIPTDTDATAFGVPASALAQPNDTAASGEATQVTPITPSADLVITKSQPSASVNAGGTITYSVTVTNNGPSAALNVVVTDTLPVGSTFVSASNGGTQAVGVVTWNGTSTPGLVSLANGGSLTFTVTITAP